MTKLPAILTIAALAALASLTACSPLEPLPLRTADTEVVPAADPIGAEGGLCLAEPCDPPPTDTPNVDQGGLSAGECDTPGEGGCPGEPAHTVPPAPPVPDCSEGGAPVTTVEGGATC